MHNVSRIAAILLVVLATVLALVAFSLGRRRAETPPPVVATTAPAAVPVLQPKTVHAIVAGQMLPAGQVIRAASLRDVALSAAPDGSYAQPELLVGQVPRVDIPEGTVVTSSLLSNPVAMQLRPGERALAVPVDEISGAGYRVQPGDYVDVVLTLKVADPNPTAMGKEHSESRLLASRLRVLAYGVRDLPNAGVTSNATTSAAKSEQTEAPPKMALLAVPMADIDPLVLGAQSGKLSLALRHPGDEGMPSDLLFPLPGTVLSPRGDLTAEQRTWLATPENRAFAGVDEPGLVGRSRNSAPRWAPRTSSQGSLEIIRGSTSTSSVAPSHAPVAVTP